MCRATGAGAAGGEARSLPRYFGDLDQGAPCLQPQMMNSNYCANLLSAAKTNHFSLIIQ